MSSAEAARGEVAGYTLDAQCILPVGRDRNIDDGIDLVWVVGGEPVGKPRVGGIDVEEVDDLAVGGGAPVEREDDPFEAELADAGVLVEAVDLGDQPALGAGNLRPEACESLEILPLDVGHHHGIWRDVVLLERRSPTVGIPQ